MPELTLATYPGPLPPFARTLGPRQSPRLAIVGEALGEQEDLTGSPFSGTSGQELTRMLREAGISRSECFLTNTFAFRPARNQIEALCVPKAEAGPQYPMPPYRMGKYFHPKLLPEVDRLRAELAEVRPNLVLALGNTAAWALLGRAAISAIRGTVATSTLVPGLKVLPTYHPAGVLRNWAWRPIVITDLLKAERERHFPDIRRPECFVLVNPTLSEIAEWFQRPASMYAVDIETAGGQITMIGFARNRSDSIVIPFVDHGCAGSSYWRTHGEEREAWQMVKRVLEAPTPKVLQNGAYDAQYLAKMGFRLKGFLHDTMLLHHSMYPEMNKGLGFLGSCYTNHSSWKLMRAEPESTKRDE